MRIDYDHAENLHTLAGPRAALPVLFAEERPESLLDVGCGTGTWLKAAEELGVKRLRGVDGLETKDFLLAQGVFQKADLSQPIALNEKFDCAICLEVGEHLNKENAKTLVMSLVRHSDKIVFSAACPGQPGQHHVNCQWPAYWQGLFNAEGYSCDDGLRWRLWNVQEVEAWYRQNIFMARRNASGAGKEKRIEPVVHPEMVSFMTAEACHQWTQQISNGPMPTEWYLKIGLKGIFSKIVRKIQGTKTAR